MIDAIDYERIKAKRKQTAKILCSSIILHDINITPKTIEALYEESLAWIASHGRVPDKMSVSRPDKKEARYNRFDRTDSKLRKEGFEGIDSISLVVSDDLAYITDRDYEFNALIDFDRSTLFLSTRVPVANIFEEPSQQHLRNMIRLGKPKYGYGFYRISRYESFFYTCGVPTAIRPSEETPESRLEDSRITRWERAGANAKFWSNTKKNVYEIGDMRDLYPWNYLTQPALTRKIQETTLQKWIEADRSRGELEPIDRLGCIWRLTEDEITANRDALIEADILFDPRPFVGKGLMDNAAWAEDARKKLGFDKESYEKEERRRRGEL